MNRNRFDVEKAVEVLLYITEKANNMYNVLKVLYFADKEHLGKFGRLICGDSYVAMNKGPVPSGLYDIVKQYRGDGAHNSDITDKNILTVDGFDLIPNRRANTDLLSASDLECLDNSINIYGHMSFGELYDKSHGSDMEAADENDFIALEDIIQSIPEDILPDPENLIEHIAG